MSETGTPMANLAEAFYEHVQATIHLAKVALELEWTVLTRFIVGVIVATSLSTVYLVLTLRHSRRPLAVWEKLNIPLVKIFRPKIFTFLLNNMNPYSGSIDMRISTFNKGFCSGFMRDKQKNRNPFKSIHATALATFAESIGELGLLSVLKEDKDEISLVSIKLEFKKKARGLISASTDFTVTDEDLTKTENPRKVNMEVVLRDHTLDTVAIAHLLWLIE